MSMLFTREFVVKKVVTRARGLHDIRGRFPPPSSTYMRIWIHNVRMSAFTDIRTGTEHPIASNILIAHPTLPVIGNDFIVEVGTCI